MKLKVVLENKDLSIDQVLVYAHDNDAGADVISQYDILVRKGENRIPLGFSMKLPSGIAGLICPRSSVMGSPVNVNLAPVDADYEGQWHLILNNFGDEFMIHKGERFCQIVLIPVVQAQFVSSFDNLRKGNGIGSTGK